MVHWNDDQIKELSHKPDLFKGTGINPLNLKAPAPITAPAHKTLTKIPVRPDPVKEARLAKEADAAAQPPAAREAFLNGSEFSDLACRCRFHGGMSVYRFTVPGEVMGKPTMTVSDKWQVRPVVARYREFCDRIRLYAGRVPENPQAVIIHAYFAMSASWSKKKQLNHVGKLMRQKPDHDNVTKAVDDALFEKDQVLGGGICWEYWCYPGKEHMDVIVLYDVCDYTHV